MKPMISVAAASGLLDAITEAGGDPEQVLHAVDLHPSALAHPDRRIPCSMFARILEEAARITGDACFGLHFGERFNPKNIGSFAYVILNSPTVAAADENAARYLKLYNQAASLSSAVEGERVYLKYELCGLEGIAAPRQQNEYSIAIRLNTIRMMVGSQWTPLEVQFAHPAPEQVSEHQRVFGAPVLFGYPTNNLVVEREFLTRQVPGADERLYRIIRRYLDEVLEQMPLQDDLLAAVRRAVAECMRNGDPNIASVGKKMAMNPRTLQRQMKQHGVRFKSFVDEIRHHFALNYLKDGKHTLTEIAFLLGYSEVSAFNRSFKRWTGQTPSVYRRRLSPVAAMPPPSALPGS